MITSKKITLNKTDIYSEAVDRLSELKKIRCQIIKVLEKAPEGKIATANNRGSIQYYLRMDSSEKTGKYIRKNQIDTIRLYLQKAYYEKVIKLISDEICNLETFLINSNECVAKIQELYSNNPQEIKNKISPIDMSDEDYAIKWAEIPFTAKTILEEGIIRRTKKGERVRSKSELAIANALFDAGIEYKYECPLQLNNGITIYPDFTTLNKRERKVIYWEHRGMMDDRGYAINAVGRIKEMAKSGIYLGDNLIITEETLSSSLGTDEIERVINHYLR